MKNIFKSRAKAMCRENSGQISIIVALVLIPILTIAGLAIDFQRTSTYKSRVQYAMDGALIAGSKAKQEGKTNAEIAQIVSDYMNAVLSVGEGELATTYCHQAVVDVAQNSEDINASINCSYPTTLSMAIGRTEMNFEVNSTSTYGIGNLDVAFVFDVSGSMGGSRIRDLRDAAKTAVDILLPEGANNGNGLTRIAMTSYSNMVDAGDYFEAVTGKTPFRQYTEHYSDWQSTGVCIRFAGRSRRCREYQQQLVNFAATYTINDTCVYERDGVHAFNDAPPGANETYTFNDADGNPQTGTGDSYLTERQPIWDSRNDHWDAPSRSCTDHPPLPLTDDVSALKKYIDDLDPSGLTAGHQGTQWGWYLISPHWGDIWVSEAGEDARPFSYDEPDTAKAVIMMTDGTFNQVHHTSQGSSSEQAIATCDIAKENGIVIYTVAFQATSSAEATLEACATGPEYSHTPDNSQELEDAYQAIATSISDLRIKF